VDFDLAGGFVHAKDFVVVEITLVDTAVVTVISLLRAWARPKLMALASGLRREGVDDGAAIYRADDAVDAKSSFWELQVTSATCATEVPSRNRCQCRDRVPGKDLLQPDFRRLVR